MSATSWRLPLGLLLVTLRAHGAAPDPAKLPVDQLVNYEAFRVRCSKCHTLEKPYNVQLDADGWRRYVQKMQRRAGSGINAENGAKIVSFLVYLEGTRNPAPPQPPALPPAPPPPPPLPPPHDAGSE